MAHQNKKRKHRSYKYHAITFKLSAGQYQSLRNYCKARKTTPIKLIKKNIERFITAYEYEIPQELYITENQLDLFSELHKKELNLFDEVISDQTESCSE